MAGKITNAAKRAADGTLEVDQELAEVWLAALKVQLKDSIGQAIARGILKDETIEWTIGYYDRVAQAYRDAAHVLRQERFKRHVATCEHCQADEAEHAAEIAARLKHTN